MLCIYDFGQNSLSIQVTFVIINTIVMDELAVLLASELVSFIGGQGTVKSVLVLSALHFLPTKGTSNGVHFHSLNEAKLEDLHSGAKEESKLAVPQMPGNTVVKDNLISALLSFLEVQRLPTHCFFVPGHRVSASGNETIQVPCTKVRCILELTKRFRLRKHWQNCFNNCSAIIFSLGRGDLQTLCPTRLGDKECSMKHVFILEFVKTLHFITGNDRQLVVCCSKTVVLKER